MLVFIINWVFIISTNANRAADTVNIRHMSRHKYSHTFGRSHCYLERRLWPDSAGHSRENGGLEMGGRPCSPHAPAGKGRGGQRRWWPHRWRPGWLLCGKHERPGQRGPVYAGRTGAGKDKTGSWTPRPHPPHLCFASIAIKFTILKCIIQ